MKKIIFILIIMNFFCSQSVYAYEQFQSDEFTQLKEINKELNQQLLEANKQIQKLQAKDTGGQIPSNFAKELEKTKRILANQSCEIKMLREKLMIKNDCALNGE